MICPQCMSAVLKRVMIEVVFSGVCLDLDHSKYDPVRVFCPICGFMAEISVEEKKDVG